MTAPAMAASRACLLGTPRARAQREGRGRGADADDRTGEDAEFGAGEPLDQGRRRAAHRDVGSLGALLRPAVGGQDGAGADEQHQQRQDPDAQGEPRPGGLLGGEVADAAVRRRLGRGSGGQDRLLSPGRCEMRGGPCPGLSLPATPHAKRWRGVPRGVGPIGTGRRGGRRIDSKAWSATPSSSATRPTASGRLALERAIQEAKLRDSRLLVVLSMWGGKKTAFDEVTQARAGLSRKPRPGSRRRR